MWLDPSIARVVERQRSGPPPHEAAVEDLRRGHDAVTRALSGEGEPVAEVREVHAPGPRGPIPIRVYRPAGEPAPGLVAYAHGGGWVLGSLDGFDPLCRALCNRSSAVVASIGYRLAPEFPFPAPLEDVCAALRWLAANAASLGADPARMAVAGDSAGASLVAVAARRLAGEGGPPLRQQVLVYPVCDSAMTTESYRRHPPDGPGPSPESMAHFWRLHLQGADGSSPDASPLRAPSLAGLPPALVLTVAADVLRDEGEAYAAALRDAGVPATVVRYDGAAHGFFRWLEVGSLARQAVAQVGASLRESLA